MNSSIIPDFNDLWSEKIKRYDTYLLKSSNMNCNKLCFLDFVKPASPSWSDEFCATSDYASIDFK